MKALMIGFAAALAAGAAVAQTTAPAANSPTGPATSGTMTAPATPATPGAPMTGTTRPGVTGSTTGMTSPGVLPGSSNTAAGRNPAAGDSNQAVATTRASASMPAKGKNSFTQAQARKRLESNGFTNVAGLTKDRDGVWRGHGQKSGNSTDVWVDYKGNVGPQ